MRRVLLWTPIVAFAIVFVLVAAGLWRPADRTVRSALIGRTMPALALPPLIAGKPGLSGGGGSVRLVNVFASWCVPCAAEAPQLMRLAAMGVAIDAVAVRDTAPAVAAFLRRHGDPYARIGDDRAGRFQPALGSSGMPETYVVDARGVIVAHHVGEVRADDVPRLAAIVRSAR